MAASELRQDWQRRERIGFDEAVFCAGKTPAQIDHVLDSAAARGASLLLTRLNVHQQSSLDPAHQSKLDYDARSRTAFFGDVAPPPGPARVAVVTAGTSDVSVACEASRTLSYYGEAVVEINDVGVAGLWRLLERVDEIKRSPVVIVVAGMDGALPSVLGGLVPGAVIAVPTSVGYGACAGGHTALNSALASCAPGLVVVNIDNGYGAACAALRMVKAFT
ncbi:MAG: nickel pincer cofactor biosynthesis protein LarB [Gammaproteobacteria bacterium]